CDRLVEWGKKNARSKILPPPSDEREINHWKEKLNLEEAEIRELETKIRKMVRKTTEAGALSWKIARAYMKVGNYELGSRYYTQALKENQEGKTEVIGAEVHFFESAIPYFEKTSAFRKADEDLLFETGLAFANASRDRGWDRERRETALKIFRGLTRLNPEDTRYPYQIALIYFDSSMNDGLIDGIDPEGYNDQAKAIQIVSQILKKEPRSVPVHFARANFLYRLGRISEAEEEYLGTKSLIEQLKKDGIISEDLAKNQSYRNVLKNLEKITASKKGF
ncbi:MAG: hypothetical protein K8R21_10975, partial [Leptospira sp.]|nr:hypothetical protein [Leptospira sp.]